MEEYWPNEEEVNLLLTRFVNVPWCLATFYREDPIPLLLRIQKRLKGEKFYKILLASSTFICAF